jgi:ABC-type antimicrobial peptide transport system, ATPase component
MTEVIALDSITKMYKAGRTEIPALRGISCRIEQGEMVSITGPSGSGKSTLMNILGCLDKPTSGRYLLEGIEISKLNDNELAEIRNKKIGFVFQSFNLLSRNTALANVEMPLIYSGSGNRKQRALQVLESVGLARRANHRPNELAGGEQQRVAIARALINNPPSFWLTNPRAILIPRPARR